MDFSLQRVTDFSLKKADFGLKKTSNVCPVFVCSTGHYSAAQK